MYTNEAHRFKCTGSLVFTSVCNHITSISINILPSPQVPSTACEEVRCQCTAHKKLNLANKNVSKIERRSFPGKP